jgi:hypothetical protein
VEENKIMLSEYVGLPCTAVEAQSSESLLTSEDVDGESHDAGVRVVQSFSTDNSTADSAGAFRSDTPVSSVSTTESPAAAVPATPQSNPSEHALSSAAGPKEKASDAAEVDSSHTVQEGPAVDSPSTMSENAVDKPPAMSFNFEQEVQVNQKEIMDMYMKSMQQFTDSLAKMKLPLDMDNGSDKSGNNGAAATSPTDSSGTDSSAAATKKPTAQDKSPKVFYGSRAFF